MVEFIYVVTAVKYHSYEWTAGVFSDQETAVRGAKEHMAKAKEIDKIYEAYCIKRDLALRDVPMVYPQWGDAHDRFEQEHGPFPISSEVDEYTVTRIPLDAWISMDSWAENNTRITIE